MLLFATSTTVGFSNSGTAPPCGCVILPNELYAVTWMPYDQLVASNMLLTKYVVLAEFN